ncbi:molybdenum cofactor guanylyltransferase [Prolixibacteraceae bacterium JC049]|nr:molybdenum cofactor guanylyltransferase [Prolixibacteraceae bacterium JC049]
MIELNMKIDKENLTGIILAGGKSSRMGQDKGLMELDGKPMVLHVADVLQSFCSEVIISTNNTAYGFLGKELVADKVKGKGPIAGLHAGLSRSQTKWVAFIACDTPFVQPWVYEQLMEHVANADAAFPMHNGKTEPLIALFRQSALSKVEEQMANGDLKIHRLIETLNAVKVDFTQELHAFPNLFNNINTPEEFAHYLKKR